MYEEAKLFTKKEIQSLKSFNDICSKIRGEYSKDAKGLFKIWINTLNVYKEYHTNSMTQLLSALMKRTPHWKLDVYEHIETYDQIKYCFYRMCKTLEYVSDGKYSHSSLGSYQSDTYNISELEKQLKNSDITDVFMICNKDNNKI
ncbi:hypothetical protein HN385_08225 [archaeon]|jgi:hypothetical protein|nr:hypothetical protein [archaeon]